MKSIVKKFVIYSAMTLVFSSNAFAIDFNVNEAISDFTGGPLNVVGDAANDGIRSLKGITTIKGKVETKVIARDITQSINGGTENANDLNIGGVSGGAYIDGSFKSDVRVGTIKQTLYGNKNVNRANIGSVSN